MMWAALIAIASFGAASDEIYVYPDVYEHGDGLGAAVNEEALAKLIEDKTTSGDGDDGIPSVEHKIDLNHDGKAEIFLAPSRVESTHADWYDIFELRGERYEEIGSCANWFTLCNSKNGYARILVNQNIGMRTEPIWTASVYVFDGGKYVSEYESDLTSGQMEALGLDAYRTKHYEVAEKRFLSLIRCGLGNPLQNENNLALVLIRTKRYQEAIDRLEAAMARFEPKEREYFWSSMQLIERAKQKANGHYNLGKAYEALGNLPAAWKNYYEACKNAPTDERKATLKRLAKDGVDTTGYEVIW